MANVGGLQDFMKAHSYLTIMAIVIGVCLFCAILCCKNSSKEVPLNYILLFTFTFVWSWMVAGLVIWYTPEAVLMCTIMVFFMLVGLTLFACFTKSKNLEICWAMGAVLGMCFWPTLIFCWIFPSNIAYIFLYLLVAVLSCIYIVYDTRAICEKYKVDEYIIAALILYVDIIQLFIMILSLCGR